MEKALLLQPLDLPCGTQLKNRLVKAAMTERLSGADFAPNGGHLALYRLWATGGTGLLITGNMMVDDRYLESGGNIAPLHGHQDKPLRAMAEAAQSGGGQVWVQLNHPGRQCSRFNTFSPVSASDVQLRKLGLFSKPKPLSEAAIQPLIRNYVLAAKRLLDSGFDGIQVHAAHGYLLSQFLSPLTNRRQDQYGGSLENRARLLLEIVDALRESCGPRVPLSVKLNSADFQRGGFEEDDSLRVIHWLEERGLDLLEVSGGSYERLVFLDRTSSTGNDTPALSTQLREAYFADFARRVKRETRIPIMVTGGFRTREGCERALQEGVTDLIGMARPYLTDPAFAGRFLNGSTSLVHAADPGGSLRALRDMAIAGYWDKQVELLSKGRQPRLSLSPWASILHLTWRELSKGLPKRLQR